LQWLQEKPPGQGRGRQIFLLTDGEISNVDKVLDLCRAMVTSARIFSFGLGHSPSRSLVKGLARATNGRFVFIPSDTSVDVYVGEQLLKALQPCIINVQVKWNLDASFTTSVPTKTPPVYVNDRLIVYALLEDKSSLFDHNFSVELKTEQHRLGEAKVIRVPSVSNNEMITRLAAKALVFELQHSKLSLSSNKTTASNDNDEVNKETIKKHIIELSLKYNILSPHTAFVGVEKRIDASNDNMVLREIPIQISADDQHLRSQSRRFPQGGPHILFNSIPRHSLWGNGISSNSRVSNLGGTCYAHDPSLDASNAQAYSYSTTSYSTAMSLDVDCSWQRSSSHKSNHSRKSNSLLGHRNTFRTIERRNSKKAKVDVWPINNQDIVRYLIDKQKFDGTWDFDSSSIEQLTGKPLSDFQQTTDDQVLVTAITIAVLETSFALFSSMWHGVAQKARQRLVDLLGKDMKAVDSLLEDIRKQL
jgi:hypothetical protein